jgi:hypothetical protein
LTQVQKHGFEYFRGEIFRNKLSAYYILYYYGNMFRPNFFIFVPIISFNTIVYCTLYEFYVIGLKMSKWGRKRCRNNVYSIHYMCLTPFNSFILVIKSRGW